MNQCGSPNTLYSQASWWGIECQNIKVHTEWGLRRAALTGPIRRGQKGLGTPICPEFHPSLKSQAQAFKEGFNQLVSGSYVRVLGSVQPRQRLYFDFSLASSRLRISTSSSASARSASELWSCSLWQNAHFFACCFYFFFFRFSLFWAVLEAAGHK